MKPIRFPIYRFMLVIAIIGANLALVRALYSTRRIDLLIGGILIGLALQGGVVRAWRTRGRARSFWLGFVGCGAVASLSVVWAVNVPRSVIGAAWFRYRVFTEEPCMRFLEASYRRNGNPAIHEIASVVVFSLECALPILLMALIGGLVARRIRRGIEGWPVPDAPSPA